ncbi:hypothetical protein DFH08DRAFT_968851 [Mycena albidolilacea]|uniref:Secreted protein n=1 Tax=Mycena albidolilacea TaxID=1033008 RepID=A0AAD6ZI64_9AGAR|nr:hypothetical protein DFH08DRAFT_968851 [Mycena albidolilacea]
MFTTALRAAAATWLALPTALSFNLSLPLDTQTSPPLGKTAAAAFLPLSQSLLAAAAHPPAVSSSLLLPPASCSSAHAHTLAHSAHALHPARFGCTARVYPLGLKSAHNGWCMPGIPHAIRCKYSTRRA